MARSSRTFKTLLLAFAKGATALVGLALAALLSRAFDKVDYATYRQALLVYQFAAPLLALGLPSALFYFLPGEESRARAILLENLILLGLMGLAFSLFLGLGGNILIARHFSNPGLEKPLLVFSLYPVLFLPASAASACLVIRDKIKWLAWHTVLTRLAQGALVVGAVLVIPNSPLVAVGATTVSAAVVFATAMILMFRATRQSADSLPTRSGMAAQLRYAIPLGLATTLETLALGIDKVLVSVLLGPEDFAIFVNGAMEIPFIRMITGAAMGVILPDLVAMYKKGKKGEALNLWQRGGRKIALLLLPIGGILFAVAPELMMLLYSDAYLDSSRPFRIYLLLLPARLIFFGVIFQAAGRSDLVLKRAFGTLILNAVVSYPMIKIFGYDGAAWGTVITFWIYVLPYCVLWGSRLMAVGWTQLMPYAFFTRVLGPVVISAGVASFVPMVGLVWFTVPVYLLLVVALLGLTCRSELVDGAVHLISTCVPRKKRS